MENLLWRPSFTLCYLVHHWAQACRFGCQVRDHVLTSIVGVTCMFLGGLGVWGRFGTTNPDTKPTHLTVQQVVWIKWTVQNVLLDLPCKHRWLYRAVGSLGHWCGCFYGPSGVRLWACVGTAPPGWISVSGHCASQRHTEREAGTRDRMASHLWIQSGSALCPHFSASCLHGAFMLTLRFKNITNKNFFCFLQK